MNIIIAGIGKVGKVLLRQLTAEGHNLTIIDQNNHVLESLVVQYDAIGIAGNCASKSVLVQAGVQDADLVGVNVIARDKIIHRCLKILRN